jgi:hypothetical protein
MVIKNLLLLLALNDSRDDDDGRPARLKKGLVKNFGRRRGEKFARSGLVFARANTPTPHYMNAEVQHQHDPSWFFLLEILRGRRDESKGTRVKWKEERARAVLIHQAASSSISRRPFIILERPFYFTRVPSKAFLTHLGIRNR